MPRPSRGVAFAVPLLAAALAHAPAQDADPCRLADAIGAPEWFDIRGSSRIRYATLDGQFRSGGSGGDQALSIRTLLEAKFQFNPVTITIEGIDCRQYLGDFGTPVGTSLVNATELLQANLSWRAEDFLIPGSESRLTVGRLTMDIGGRRLVARNRFRNTINGFTGADWLWKIDEAQSFRAFYTMPVTRLPADAESLRDNQAQFDKEDTEHTFWGAHYQHADLPLGTTAELYLVGLAENDTDDFDTHDRNLITPGIRLHRLPSRAKFDFELEGILQFGETRASSDPLDSQTLDVFACFLHATLGYTFDVPWSPRFALHYDYASGDKDPGDQAYGRFDPLFGARRFEYGPTGIYGAVARSNMSAPGCRFTLAPAKDVELMIAHRACWLASDTDSWVPTNVRDFGANSGSFVGNQIEAALTWQPLPGNLAIEAGVAHFFYGQFPRNAPNRSDQGDSTYAFVQTTIEF